MNPNQCIFRRFALLIAVSAAFLLHTVSAFALTEAELSELAGLTFRADPALARADDAIRAAGGRVALYGGNSRELLDFVIWKSDQLGGAAQYKAWLVSQKIFSTLDWHRVGSDMDLMIMPGPGQENNPAEEGKLKAVAKELKEHFPRSEVVKNLDFNSSWEFFKKFRPERENLEPISNILISARGFESVPQLTVNVDGVPRSLSRWGVEQYLRKELDFRLTRGADGAIVGDAYGKLRQVFRFVRYLNERPNFAASPEAEAAIRDLVADLRERHLPEITEILRQGALEKADSTSKERKAVEALEKAQLNSLDSLRSRKRLTELGIESLLDSAGVKDKLILTPLPHRVAPPPASAKRLGRSDIEVYHRSSLTAAQNMSSGALYISDQVSRIGGKETQAWRGKGLYAASRQGALSYGEYYVPIPLSADAIEGIDYEKVGEIYILKTREAIAQDAAGKLLIPTLDRNRLLQNFLATLRSVPGIEDKEKISIYQALGKVVDPELSQEDSRVFEEIFTQGLKDGGVTTFVSSYLGRPGFEAKDNEPWMKEMVQKLATSLADHPLPLNALEEARGVVARFPSLRAALATRVIHDFPGNLDQFPTLFPLPTMQKDLLERELPQMIRALPLKTMQFLAENGVGLPAPYDAILDLVHLRSLPEKGREEKIRASSRLRSLVQRLSPPGVSYDEKVAAYVAAPEEMASIVDEDLIRAVAQHQVSYISPFAAAASRDPIVAARVHAAFKAHPDWFLPWEITKNFPALKPSPLMEELGRFRYESEVRYLFDRPQMSRLFLLEEKEKKGALFASSLHDKDLTKLQRYVLAFAAYRQGSEDPGVRAELFHLLADKSLRSPKGGLPKWIAADAKEASAQKLQTMLELIHAYEQGTSGGLTAEEEGLVDSLLAEAHEKFKPGFIVKTKDGTSAEFPANCLKRFAPLGARAP